MDDPSVGELFMAVEGLRGLHQSFADKVEDRLYRWSRNEVIGDILLDMVSRRGWGYSSGTSHCGHL